MIKLNKKLTNRAGASLGISLLLFLVCAVLGSVILTAGTTTMSRVSAVSGSDQRYYSVTSAAELMKQELVGKTVKIEKTRVKADNAATPSYTVLVQGQAVSGADLYAGMSYLTSCATRLMFGSEAINTDTAMDATFAQGRYLKKSDSNEYVDGYKGKREETTIKLDHEGNDGHEVKGMDVEAVCTLLEDGTLIIKLTNINDDATADPNPYTLTMTLTPVFEETSSVSKDTNYSTGVTTETKVNTSTVHWEIGGISKRFTAES